MIESNQALKSQLIESFEGLLSAPPQRAFLFRTRCERGFIGVSSYADQIGDEALRILADESRQKLSDIVDKSNTTSDGMLRSYKMLSADIKQILSRLAA